MATTVERNEDPRPAAISSPATASAAKKVLDSTAETTSEEASEDISAAQGRSDASTDRIEVLDDKIDTDSSDPLLVDTV